MIESIEVYLNYVSQQSAIRIHEALLSNSWFGLMNKNRRLFFDVKHKTIYQVRDDLVFGATPRLTVMELDNDEIFKTYIKLTLLTCKVVLTDIQIAQLLANIKILLTHAETKKEIGGEAANG